MAPRKITSSLHRVLGLSGWVTLPTAVVLSSSRRAAEGLGLSGCPSYGFFSLIAFFTYPKGPFPNRCIPFE